MNSYDRFLEYYDEIVRGIHSPIDDEFEFLLEDCIKNYFPSARNILELACGTGKIAKKFQEHGYKISGLDINEKMLQKAQKQIGEENCILGDMTNFSLGEKFDVVLCNYNSINHLLEFSQWEQMFQQIYQHLQLGGLLIFDINTLFEFESITRDFAQFYSFGENVVCLEMFKKETYYEWLVKMFEKQEKNIFQLTTEVVREQSFPIDRISTSLQENGFLIEEMIDFHYGKVQEESERVYFICRKK